jgi:hypothetical protein
MGDLQVVTRLTDAQRRGALEHFRLLRPCLEEGMSLSQVARQAGVPLRTAQR